MGRNRSYLLSVPTDVYRVYDSVGSLLYVGISVNVPNRLIEHRSYKAWFQRADVVSVERYSSRWYARWVEARAIAEEHPEFNQRPEAWYLRLGEPPHEVPRDTFSFRQNHLLPPRRTDALVQD